AARSRRRGGSRRCSGSCRSRCWASIFSSPRSRGARRARLRLPSSEQRREERAPRDVRVEAELAQPLELRLGQRQLERLTVIAQRALTLAGELVADRAVALLPVGRRSEVVEVEEPAAVR